MNEQIPLPPSDGITVTHPFDVYGLWRLESATDEGILSIGHGIGPDNFVYMHRSATSTGVMVGGDAEWGTASAQGLEFTVDGDPGAGLSALGITSVARDGDELVLAGTGEPLRFERIAVVPGQIEGAWLDASPPYDGAALDVFLADGTFVRTGWAFDIGHAGANPPAGSVSWGTYEFDAQTGALDVDMPGTAFFLEGHPVIATFDGDWLRLDLQDDSPLLGPDSVRSIGAGADDLITGSPGDDVLPVDAIGWDTVIGGAGIDTVIGSWFVTPDDDHHGEEADDYHYGNAQLRGVERVHTPSGHYAIDFGPGGHAEIVTRILGAVFGRDAVANHEAVGAGLALVDAGMSEAALFESAMVYRLGDDLSLTSAIHLLWSNIANRAPSQAEYDFEAGLVQSQALTGTQLGLLAVDSFYNAQSIGLAGLVETGVEYA